jgi:hypothetical protein
MKWPRAAAKKRFITHSFPVTFPFTDEQYIDGLAPQGKWKNRMGAMRFLHILTNW